MPAIQRQTKNSLKHDRQHGQISIEYLAVITLVAIAVAGISWFAYAAVTKAKLNKEIQAVKTTLDNARSLYSVDPDGFTGVTGGTLVRNNAVPDEYIRPGMTIPRIGFPILGPMAVRADTIRAANDSIAFEFSSFNPEKCSDIIVGLEQSFSGVMFGPIFLKFPPTPASGGGRVLDPQRLGEFCAFYIDNPGVRTAAPLTFYATLN